MRKISRKGKVLCLRYNSLAFQKINLIFQQENLTVGKSANRWLLSSSEEAYQFVLLYFLFAGINLLINNLDITSFLLTRMLLGELLLVILLELLRVPSNIAEIVRIGIYISYCLDIPI